MSKILAGITAHLLPLEGKYYGSKILIQKDARALHTINVWIIDERVIPSKRFLRYYGYEDGQVEEAKADDLTCDTHFESDVCLEICEAIVEAINARGGKV